MGRQLVGQAVFTCCLLSKFKSFHTVLTNLGIVFVEIMMLKLVEITNPLPPGTLDLWPLNYLNLAKLALSAV